MAYKDRVRDFVYISPSGKSFTLQYDDVERSGGHKSAIHELPFQPGVTIQDLGNSGEKFPITGYFTGPDYDQSADAFISALQERGLATIKHPRYGDITVLCISWTLAESFVEGMGRASFNLDLQQHTDAQSLIINTNSQQTVFNNSEIVNQTLLDNADDMAVSTPAAKSQLAEKTILLVTQLENEVATIVNGYTDLSAMLTSETDLIKRDINNLINDEKLLMGKLITVINVASGVTKDAKSLISDWKKIVNAIPKKSLNTNKQNNALLTYSSVGTFSACCANISKAKFKSKTDAAFVRSELYSILNTVRQNIIENEQSGEFVLGTDISAAIDNLYASTENYLMNSDFPVEQIYLTEYEITPIQLAHKLLGSFDKVDDIIDANDFNGDRLLIVPAGVEVKYYA